MTAERWGLLLPALAAMITAVVALYRAKGEARKIPASVANMETSDALATLGRVNDALEKRNATLEHRVDDLEELVQSLRKQVRNLQAELEGYKRERK